MKKLKNIIIKFLRALFMPISFFFKKREKYALPVIKKITIETVLQDDIMEAFQKKSVVRKKYKAKPKKKVKVKITRKKVRGKKKLSK